MLIDELVRHPSPARRPAAPPPAPRSVDVVVRTRAPTPEVVARAVRSVTDRHLPLRAVVAAGEGRWRCEFAGSAAPRDRHVRELLVRLREAGVPVEHVRRR